MSDAMTRRQAFGLLAGAAPAFSTASFGFGAQTAVPPNRLGVRIDCAEPLGPLTAVIGADRKPA
jgi:hypothetical protein